MIKADEQNAAGQVAKDCIEYNWGSIKKTCMREYDEPDYILNTCVVRLGEVCPYYKRGLR